MWFKTATSSIFSSTSSLRLLAVAAMAFTVAACGSDPKKAPPPPEATCTDAPGKLTIVVGTKDGKQLCNGNVTVKWGDGKESAMKLQPVQYQGKSECGFVVTKAGKATVTANGFNDGKASWKAPDVCTDGSLEINLMKSGG